MTVSYALDDQKNSVSTGDNQLVLYASLLNLSLLNISVKDTDLYLKKQDLNILVSFLLLEDNAEDYQAISVRIFS